MIRLLWINGNPNKNAGGTETHSIHFINALSKKKEVDLFVGVSKGSFVDKNIHIPENKKVYITIDGEFSPISTFKLLNFARSIKPDFVIGNNGNEYINTFLAAKFSKSKPVLFRHMTNKLPIFIRKFIIKRCFKVFAVSEYVEDKLALEGVPDYKIEVIPNFLENSFIYDEKRRKDLRSTYGLDDKLVLLFVAKIERGKGIFDFIKASKILMERYKNIVSIIVGTGKDLKKAKEMTKNFKNRFIFVGLSKNPFDYFIMSDIFVMPSLADESFGRTVVEAMATKTFVIGYPSGNVKKLIKSGENGFLTEKRSYTQIIKAVEDIISKPEIFRRCIENAYNFYLENFTEEKVINKFLTILEEGKNHRL